MTDTIVLVTGVVALITGLVGLFVKVQQVHVMVNSRMDEALTRIDQLHAALTAAGVDVPDRPPREP